MAQVGDGNEEEVRGEARQGGSAAQQDDEGARRADPPPHQEGTSCSLEKSLDKLTCVLSSQVEEVRQYKKMLMEERRELMANKLAMAEEKRQVVLRRVVRKAHEEETKVRGVSLVASSLLSSASRCLSFVFALYVYIRDAAYSQLSFHDE